jgi:hypothetical protein
MIDAIFIQSCHKEIEDNRLVRLITNIVKFSAKPIDIYVFLNKASFCKDLTNLTGVASLVQFIVVDDTTVLNPTTKVFHFMINYKMKEYPKILILESDCILFSCFDEVINQDLLTVKDKKWFIYGSKYGGNKWKSVIDKTKDYSDHMNGVAVYNRCSEFLRIINQIFVNRSLENIKTNYDYALYESLKLQFGNWCIDSKYILNISDFGDVNLQHDNIKPDAVIIHTKNCNYKDVRSIKNIINLKRGQQLCIQRKVPIFLHIPKCAGSYVESFLMQTMTWYGLNQNWHEKSAHLWNFCLRRISLTLANQQTALILFVYDFNNCCETDQLYTKIDNYTYMTSLEHFLNFNKNLEMFIFAIAIQSHGVSLLKVGIIEAICSIINCSPFYFTLLRDTFQKIKSMYSYLSGESSQHEHTHKAIKSKSFEQYLNSYEIEDCWLIRELLFLNPNQCISEEHYEKTVSYLKSYTIYDVTNTKTALQKMLAECYKIEYEKIPKRFTENLAKNESINKPSLNYSDLNTQIRDFFDNRTFYDQKIYHHFCSNIT